MINYFVCMLVGYNYEIWKTINYLFYKYMYVQLITQLSKLTQN